MRNTQDERLMFNNQNSQEFDYNEFLVKLAIKFQKCEDLDDITELLNRIIEIMSATNNNYMNTLLNIRYNIINNI